MKTDLTIAILPYHLTTREVPAMAALFLAGGVVTLLPGALHQTRGAGDSPTWSRLLHAWSWSVPAWRSGLLRTQHDHDAGVEDFAAVRARLRDDEELAPLRSFLREDCHEDDAAHLASVAKDLLRGGPDPAILLPVAAALDRFSARRGFIVARAVPASLAQKAEANQSSTSATCVVPIFLQATCERVLRARGELEPELRAFRRALAAAAQGDVHARELSNASSTLREAFESRREAFMQGCEHDDVRAVDALASVSLVSMPADSVLTSGLCALGSLAKLPPAQRVTTTLPVPHDPMRHASCLSIIVKPLGQR